MSFIEYLISLIADIYMLIIMLFCYKRISNRELKLNFINILVIIAFAILLMINNLYSYIYIRLILSLLLNTMLNKIIFKSSAKEAFKYTFIYFIISFLLELLLLPVFSLLDKGNITKFNQDLILKNLFSFLTPLIVLYMFFNKRLSLLTKKLIVAFKNEITYIKINLITIIFLNVMTILVTDNLNNKTIITLAVSSIIFIIFAYRIIINDKCHIVELEELNLNLKLSHKAYSSTLDECKELKHNLKNDLIALKSVIKEEYKDSINEILLKYNKKYEWISKIDEIPEGLQGMIYLKSNEAKKKNIKFFINVKNNITTINKDYFSLCSVLGIILDNAIENCKNNKEKIISIYIKTMNNIMEIEVINSFSNKIDLDKIGNKNYSTKSNKSGIGINYIKNLKNKNINVNYSIVNNLFISKISYNN